MGLDIRKPLGYLFLATGVLLIFYGIITRGSPIYAKSVGINVNLYWGIVMLVFGAIMYALSFRPVRIAHRNEGETPAPPRRSAH